MSTCIPGRLLPEHLRFAFTRAVAATDRAIGYWLTRHSAAVLGDSMHPS